MAKKQREEPNASEWLNTYADMVTLLLTFFIMLFTMSSVNAEKWDILMKAFVKKGNETSQIVLIPDGQGQDLAGNASGTTPSENNAVSTSNELPVNFDQLYEYVKTYVEENGMTGSVEITKQDDNVFIRLKDNIFFDPDSAVLKASSTGILDFLGDCVKNMENNISVVNINGHTAKISDNYSIATDRTLSSSRANSVLVYFQERKSVDGKKLTSMGYGNHYPIADNATQDGRARNRRVELLIIGKESKYAGIMDLQTLMQGSFTDSPMPSPTVDDLMSALGGGQQGTAPKNDTENLQPLLPQDTANAAPPVPNQEGTNATR